MAFRNDLYILLKLHPDKPWDWERLSMSDVITPDIVFENMDKPWNWYNLSQRPSMTRNVILAHLEAPWDLSQLICIGVLTYKDIEEYPHLPWNWNTIYVDDIPWSFILKHKDKPWDWEHEISWKSDMTADIIMQIMDKPIDWQHISAYLRVTKELLLATQDKPWDWDRLSTNSCITRDIVDAFPDKPWNPNYLAQIMDITWKDLKDGTRWDYTLCTRLFVHQGLCYPNHRILRKFIYKVRLAIARRKRIKKIYDYCMTEIVMRPELGVEYFRLKSEDPLKHHLKHPS